MQYGYAFKFMSYDKDWVTKVLVAGLIALIPVFGPIYLLGWMIEIARRESNGRKDLLPESNYSELFVLGLKALVIAIVYSIPAQIITEIVQALVKAQHGTDGAFSSFVLWILIFAFSCLTVAAWIWLYMMIFSAWKKLAETNNLSDGFKFKEVFNDVKDHLKTYIIVFLFYLLSIVINTFGWCVCLIGALFTAPYSNAIFGNVLGQMIIVLNGGSVDEDGTRHINANAPKYTAPAAAAKPAQTVIISQTNTPAGEQPAAPVVTAQAPVVPETPAEPAGEQPASPIETIQAPSIPETPAEPAAEQPAAPAETAQTPSETPAEQPSVSNVAGDTPVSETPSSEEPEKPADDNKSSDENGSAENSDKQE